MWLFVVLVAFSVVHILMITAVNIPAGPFHQALRSVYQGYIDPIFYQDWRLFAPNPVVADRGYLIRVKYDDKISPWADITVSAINKKLANPLLPRKEYDMLQSAYLDLQNWETPELQALRDKRLSQLSLEESVLHEDDEDYRYTLVPITAEELKAKKRGESFAFNALVTYAKKTFPPGFTSVQLRTVTIPARPPKFDDVLGGNEDDEPVTRADSPWLTGAAA